MSQKRYILAAIGVPEQNINSKMSPGSNYSLRGLFRVWHTDSMIHPYMFIIDHTPWPVIDRGQNFVGAGPGILEI